MATTEQWLAKIARLKVDKARGDPAPHKPLLLLVVLELAELELLKSVLPLTPELAFRFATYWSIVAERRTQPPDVSYPFHHLKGDGFWSPFDGDGHPSPDRKLTRFAAIPTDFLHFASDPIARENSRRLLIARYFEPNERVALYELVGLPVPEDDQIKRDANFRPSGEAVRQGREARFRLLVVAAYNYTCALTGYRLTTIRSGSIVDAAHIHQFADSRNNNPTNGLALCKNAHWLFDQGLWTVSDDFRIVVAVGKFAESSPDGKALCEYHNQALRLPADRRLWPNPVHLGWHRRHRFQGV